MAISLTNFVLHSTQNLHNLRFENTTKLSTKTSLFGHSENKIKFATRKNTSIGTTVSEDSLSTLITELKKDKEESISSQVEKSWKKLCGENNWEGLLDPIDPVLRSELIRYGEMAQACYDAFDFDEFSIYCGSCRFNKADFLEALGMKDSHGYEVSRYLYATANINFPKFSKKSKLSNAWSNNANWIGYVAVSNDETTKKIGRRDITVAWRGTITSLEWISDLLSYLSPVPPERIPVPDPAIKIETGFLQLYTDKDLNCQFCKHSAREQILTEVKRLIEKYPNEELSITITGHSLGAALAVLSAYDLAETEINKTKDGRVVPICVYSFSGPRVGNFRFKERFEELGIKVLRILNVHDVVPKSPGFFINEKTSPAIIELAKNTPWAYSHVGVELELDHDKSPFLRESNDLGNFHNLETHLHLIDGFHGKSKEFKLTTGRDPALINKSSGFLKDEFLVPPSWRQYANKGLVTNETGRWMQPKRPKLDDHPEDMIYHLKELGLASDN